MIFLALSIWWDQGKHEWELNNPCCAELSRLRVLQRVLLPVEEVVYEDDKNGLNLADTSAQRHIDYTAESGPALGLVLNLAKCVVRRIIAISAFFP